jgi:putative colanic acid biosynthesis acetyltransferase WcaF
MSGVSLRAFDNSWYSPGCPSWVQALWFLLGMPLLRSRVIPFSGFRVLLLRAFGARIGTGAVIKPAVRVKYPWLFEIGNDCWIGEDCWIDNLAPVTLGSNVCISQGAYLCTGNHDWSDPAFGLRVGAISLRDGSWVGARAVLCPGVEFGEGAIATAGSVVAQSIPAWEIHAGNPAKRVKVRTIRSTAASMARA